MPFQNNEVVLQLLKGFLPDKLTAYPDTPSDEKLSASTFGELWLKSGVRSKCERNEQSTFTEIIPAEVEHNSP